MKPSPRRPLSVLLIVALSVGLCVFGWPSAARADSSPRFVRGHADSDGQINITDVITLLTVLFLDSTKSLACEDAADTNDDGRLDLSDAVRAILLLFISILRATILRLDLRDGSGHPLLQCRQGVEDSARDTSTRTNPRSPSRPAESVRSRRAAAPG